MNPHPAGACVRLTRHHAAVQPTHQLHLIKQCVVLPCSCLHSILPSRTLQVHVSGALGTALQLQLTDQDGNSVAADTGSVLLQQAAQRPLSEEEVAAAVGQLGDNTLIPSCVDVSGLQLQQGKLTAYLHSIDSLSGIVWLFDWSSIVVFWPAGDNSLARSCMDVPRVQLQQGTFSTGSARSVGATCMQQCGCTVPPLGSLCIFYQLVRNASLPHRCSAAAAAQAAASQPQGSCAI